MTWRGCGDVGLRPMGRQSGDERRSLSDAAPPRAACRSRGAVAPQRASWSTHVFGRISTVSRLHLGCISAASRLHLDCISEGELVDARLQLLRHAVLPAAVRRGRYMTVTCPLHVRYMSVTCPLHVRYMFRHAVSRCGERRFLARYARPSGAFGHVTVVKAVSYGGFIWRPRLTWGA